jgi:PAS domain-containing protein
VIPESAQPDHLRIPFLENSKLDDPAIRARRENVLPDARERLRRLQDALLRSEERFRYAVQAEQNVIWELDVASERLTFEISGALCSVWGYAFTEGSASLGWWMERIHPQEREVLRASLVTALERAAMWTAECRFQCADGSYGYADNRPKMPRKSGVRRDQSVARRQNPLITQRSHNQADTPTPPAANVFSPPASTDSSPQALLDPASG